MPRRAWRGPGILKPRRRQGPASLVMAIGIVASVASCSGGAQNATAASATTGGARSTSRHHTDMTSKASESSMPTTAGHAIATTLIPDDVPLTIDVLALGRVSKQIVALRLRVTNVGKTSTDIQDSWTSSENGRSTLENGSPWGALVLVDGDHMKAYHPLTVTSDGSVAQTGFQDSNGNMRDFRPHDSFVSTILYPAPPRSVTHVDVEASETPPLVDVPIAPAYQLEKGDPSLHTPMNVPYVQTLSEQSDALDASSTADHTGGQTTVNVKSDVLFAFDKAALTSRAARVLKRVAARIDRSGAGSVRVDGYTDSQGTDARNVPLSNHRARAVVVRLKKLVRRRGIRWVADGHGSADPVATNDTKAGRQKNRRVTITIGRGQS